MKMLPMLLLLAASGLQAQAGDPLKSPACARALATLEAARADGARSAAAPGLRQQAAQACLGGGQAQSRSVRPLQAPIAVPPPPVAQQPQPPAAAARLHAPPVGIARPATPAHCDAGGCWVDDGAHLRQVPPSLAGPNGPCVQQAGQLLCQ